jgi:hypothetical protein
MEIMKISLDTNVYIKLMQVHKVVNACSGGGENMNRRVIFAARLFSAGILFSCLTFGGSSVSDRTQSNSEYGALQYGTPKEVCKMKDNRLGESSGIAASIINKNAFWSHNDSGDSARIFLFNKSCEIIAVVNLKNVKAVDWEDIASFKKGEDGFVIIADTGDNLHSRKTSVLYIIREPLVTVKPGATEAAVIDVTPEATITFSFEDGPHDCESVAVDPAESTIYLASKARNESKIYSIPIPANGEKQPSVAKIIATHKLPYATSMDISSDRTHAVILNYQNAFEFSRLKGETWAQAFSREPRMMSVPPRPQGEAICYGTEGKTLYLTSEGASQPVWEMPPAEDSK